MIIYTDGSAHPNPGPGGYGVVVMDDNNKLIECYSHQEAPTTNNIMELKAVLFSFLRYGRAVANCNSNEIPIVYSDSNYVVQTFNNWMFGWAKKGWLKSDNRPPENLELIQAYYNHYQKGFRINLQKVKGHQGILGNVIADKLATETLTTQEVYRLYGG
jgi:ribonuclease HI